MYSYPLYLKLALIYVWLDLPFHLIEPLPSSSLTVYIILHLCKMVLMDQGSDLVAAKEVIETYRTKAGAKMVFYSKVGKPVQLVEQTQAQIQRRMAVFRTAGLTTDASAILEDISTSINNQKRPDRGNLTPIQLLKLTKSERLQINAMYRDKNEVPEIKGLRALFQGSRVRVLLMTFKEQVQNKTKGFAPKWSRDIYTVKKKTALQGQTLSRT